MICTLPPSDEEAYFSRHDREPSEKAGRIAEIRDGYREAALKVARQRRVAVVG